MSMPWPLGPFLSGMQHHCRELQQHVDRLRSSAIAQLQPSRAQSPVLSLAAFGGGGGGASSGGLATREEVGRATWLFLHTLAAQYPEEPTRQQQRDARNLVDILTRIYPCGECARHFRGVVAAHPPALGGRGAFSRWMCEAHNSVNQRLGKPEFNCDLVGARWGGLDCGEDEACSLDSGRRRRGALR